MDLELGEFALPAEAHAAHGLVLDLGGEGRHRAAWNLNQRRTGSGRLRDRPIPRLILGRCDAIPLADHTVELAIVERTPLRRRALLELRRVVRPRGLILLRHAIAPGGDPHRVALSVLGGNATRRQFRHRDYQVQETLIRRGHRD